MPASELPFWQHAAGATALRVLLTAARLDVSLESRIEVGTPVTAAIRYREGVQLARLGLSPYAGAAFHGPPLVLAAARTLDSLASVLPGFGSVLACAAVDVSAAAALSRLARATALQDGSPAAVSPTTLAALYLWSPLAVAAAVGGSAGGLENAAVFAALAAGAAGSAAAAGASLAAAAYLGLHPALLAGAVAMLLWRGPEPLTLQPPPGPAQPAQHAAPKADAQDAASTQLKPPACAPAKRSDAANDGSATSGTPACSRQQQQQQQQQPAPNGAGGFGSPIETPAPQPFKFEIPAVPDGRTAAEAGEPAAAARAAFRSQFKRRRRPGGGRSAAAFVAWLLAAAAALALLSDVALRHFPEHRCGGFLRLLPGGAANCAAAARERSSAGHWATETYGFLLTGRDLTPNIGLHWYFFAEMFAHFAPFWHFAFHAAAAAAAGPLLLRLPHRPLAAAAAQCVAAAMLKPYPSVSDVAQYLALLPLFAPQLAGGGFPTGLLAPTFALLAGLGPAMWHMWIYLGSANANFYYAITLAFGAWQALLLVSFVAATLRFDRLLAGKSLARW